MRIVCLSALCLCFGATLVSAQDAPSVSGLSHGLAVTLPGGELVLAGPPTGGDSPAGGVAASGRCAQEWSWVTGSWAGIYTANGFQGYATVADCVTFTDGGETRLGYRLQAPDVQLAEGEVGYAMASTAPAFAVESLDNCALALPDGTAAGVCSANGGTQLRWTTAEGQTANLAESFAPGVFAVGMLDQRTALIVPGTSGSWTLWAVDHSGAELVSSIR